ncbi:MAG: glycosyltransferase [Oxalobacter sp.]|nr:MAG: glycosyltransferase [Oxalobacter sp.]
MNRPLVTVVMNCYNGEAFLRRAIESVLAQTWKNWEIVFWDNRSTDTSAEILKSYEDSRIRYYYAPTHTFLYEARNYAIEKANGELLAFLDVDDWWFTDKLERQVQKFEDPDVAVVCSNFWIENEIKNKKWVMYNAPLPQGRVLDSLLRDYQVGLLTLMLRRSALPSDTPPFNPRYHIIGDFDLVIRLAAAHKVASVDSPLAAYRIHGKNETSMRRMMHAEELENWMNEMRNDSKISASPSFNLVLTKILYILALDTLLSGKKCDAFKHIKRMAWGMHKLRASLAFLLPTIFIKKLKN